MRIDAITIAPVKGLALNHPDVVDVTATGVRGDRRYAIVDARGNLANGKRFGTLVRVQAESADDPETLVLTLPDGTRVGGAITLGDPVNAVFYGHPRPATLVLGDFSRALSDLANAPLRLVRLADGEAIDRPGKGAVSLQTTASLAALGREAGLTNPVDGRRFRMTFTIEGAQEHAEDAWVGREVSIGDVVLVPAGNIGRCAITTQNPDTGSPDLDTLRTLARYRGNLESSERLPFGVHARVLVPGHVRVGDVVTIR